MMTKLKTALCGAAMIACMAAPVATANAESVGTLTKVGPVASTQVVHFDVLLPLRNKDKLQTLLQAQQDPASAQFHRWLTPAQFGAQFGPDRATLARVANYLQARGFTVKPYTRSLRVTGTADLVARNFGAHLVIARSEDGVAHTVTGDAMVMPQELASAGAHIFSFAPHAAHLLSHVVTGPLQLGKARGQNAGSLKQLYGYASNITGPSPANRYSETGGYWFDDLKQAYQYPSATASVMINGVSKLLNGGGATIAALMSSDVLDADIQAVFDHENWSAITGNPDPTLKGRFYIDGGAPFGGVASAEASLDTQEEITGAPGANVWLIDIPDLSDGNVVAGYLDVDEYNQWDVVSSSFGECELLYFPRWNSGQDFRGILQAEDELFMQGNSQGVTFLASSGDEAGKECPTPAYFTGGPAHYIASVSAPASDPNVTAVGGTNVVTTYVQGTLDSAYAGENAWDDPEFPNDPYGVGVDVKGAVWGAGGGYSSMWAAPGYQSYVTTGSTTWRAMPDVGMQVGGCPVGASDYHHHVCNGGNNPLNGNGNTQRSYVMVAIGTGEKGGGFFGLVGTSVSSPEFAGVVAHLVETKGRMGNLNPYIYRLAAKQAAGGRQYFHTNIPGYNGVTNTDLNSTYSLSVGVGTPIVTHFIGQTAQPQAGIPQTPSNP